MLLAILGLINQDFLSTNLDSLINLLPQIKNDSVKISMLATVSEECSEVDILKYSNQNLLLIENAYNRKSITFDYYETEKARAYNNIGVYYYSVSANYLEAIDYFLKSISLLEKKSNSNQDIDELLSSAYNTIATTYLKLDKYKLAEIYFIKSISLDKKTGNKQYLANDYNNLAALYVTINSFDKALQYFNLSLALALEDNDSLAIRTRYCNIAALYLRKGAYDLAEVNLENGFDYLKNQKDSSFFYFPMITKFSLLTQVKNYKEAEKLIPFLEKFKTDNLSDLSNYYKLLYVFYEETGNYKLALQNYKQYKTLSDSVVSEAIKNKSEIKQMSFNFEKKQLAEKNKNETLFIQETEKRHKQTYITIFTLLISIVVGAFSIVFYKKLKLTQKQNKIIEDQKSEITNQHQLLEVKSKAITDSINYSKSIQTTLLANNNKFNSYFDETFLIYNPKDIIGGDFYWAHEIGNNLLIVVGDCTGHGVPGALISVLAIEALNKIVATNPGLEELDELIKKLRDNFNQYYESSSLVSIGVDLGVIYVDKDKKEIILAGSGATITQLKDNALSKFKFDSINIGGKMPVSYTYQTIRLPLNKNDVFYLYTDGILDMKGGEFSKKFTSKKLEELLLSITDLSLAEQKEYINHVIHHWNFNSERIDDITMLAIKI
ncbi:MAG: hypothetical protein A3F72_17570 [Bacteroidetes bacterium RIFCSPLOWO2_12_FULL_35_15]|nr:MAG: hypothetical protein A3F72_17570 [Bacteroidetes bacterium RIFCSPLOWO2_12_FULL_35_15]